MHSVWMAFRECGWPSWLCLLMGLAGLAAGFVGLVLLATKLRGAAWIAGGIAVFLGLSTVGVGVVGRQVGLAKVEAILGDPDLGIDPSQLERIRAAGYQEASQCVSVGAGAGALPFVMGAFAVGIGLALRKKTPA
jgi:hypothetical protein